MSNACVLDTHAWTYMVAAPTRRGARARRVVKHADARVIPAICLWELALLHQQGRFTFPSSRDSITSWLSTASADPQTVAPLSSEVAIAAAALADEGFHRDPADRLIYATARVLDLPLVTRDTGIHAFEDQLPRRTRRLAVWD